MSASSSTSSRSLRLLAAPLWVFWALLAVAWAPLGPVSDALLSATDMESSFCSPRWVEWAQLVPPLVGFAVLVRMPRAAPWLMAFGVLLAAWFGLLGAGECAFGGDD